MPVICLLIPHQHKSAASGVSYISGLSRSLNNAMMTIELAVRCPLFTGCHGSSEEARS